MSHETQRLLFAAGRGARVQTRWSDSDIWSTTDILYRYAEDCQIPQRIHPEDVHLQYGPISTELRRVGDEWERDERLVNWTDLTYVTLNYPLVAYCMEEVHTWPYSDFDRSEHVVAPWLYAFAAELAADEGL